MAQNATTDVRIVETTNKNSTSQYGMDGCDETLHVQIDDEDVYVPWTAVRPGAYDHSGEMPDELDVERVICYDGRIHAEASVEGGVVELMPDYNSATSEFRGYDRWELARFDNDSIQEGTVVYEREE